MLVRAVKKSVEKFQMRRTSFCPHIEFDIRTMWDRHRILWFNGIVKSSCINPKAGNIKTGRLPK